MTLQPISVNRQDAAPGVRVLLVDDELQVRQAMRRLLAHSPFEIELAASGEEALSRLAETSFDVVVSDESMPGMRGSELLSRVRAAAPWTARILLTGSTSVDAAERAVNDGGVFRFLRKPCPGARLQCAIEEAVAASPPSIRTRRDDEARFARALDGLWMAAQPIVDAAARRVYAYELLVRTDAPDVPNPMVLFDLAERLGQVDALEHRILSHVPAVVATAPPGVAVFVNLHPDTIRTPELLAPLRPYARQVVLEITERASLGELGAFAEHTSTLRAQGFRIAVDDLGAGYAGLTSVAALRPEIVKLDIGLTRGLEALPTNASLVRALAACCHELGIVVVSEGIETDATRDALVALGCNLQQGYRFARPGRPFPEVCWLSRAISL